MLQLVANLLTKCIELHGIARLCKDLPQQRLLLTRYILYGYICYALYTYHCLDGTCDAYKLIFSAANFIFTVVMKVQVKPSVFVSKF